MSRLRILHVVSSYPPAYAYGGPPVSVHSSAAALAAQGHDVTVYTTDALNATSRIKGYDTPESMDNVEVYRFRNISNTLSWRNVPVAPRMWLALREHVGQFDVLHTHEYRSLQTWFAHRAADRAGVPHVLQPRGSVPLGSKSRQKRLFDTLVGKRLLTEADTVIASSDSEASQFEDVYPVEQERIAKIPNGIDPTEFEPLPEKGTFRTQFGIESDVPLVLFLSRLHDRKGGDLLLSAFARIRETYSDARLAFVGPDEGMKSSLENQAAELSLQEAVAFPGPLYGDDKLAAYHDADVFVLPSTDQYESFGNVVLEALACGTPAIATEVCGVTEWVPDDILQTASTNAESIANQILTVLQDDRKSGMKSFIKAERTWKTVAEQLSRIYVNSTAKKR